MIRKWIFMIGLLILAVAWLVSGCTPQAGPPTETLPPRTPTSPLPTPTVQVADPSPTATVSPTEEPAPGAIEVTDGLGRMVRLPGPAQQVVSLAPSNTEILFAIGAGDQVVGRDEFSDYPSEAQALPSIGGGFGDYNMEAIVDLEPDLVLAAEINTPEQVKTLEDLGLTVFYLANPESMDEMYGNLQTVAGLTGHETEAAELAGSLQARVTAVEEKIASAVDRPRVFYELDSTDPQAPWTAGPGTFIDTLIAMGGGENIGADLEGQYVQISLEQLVVVDPQVILLGDSAYGVTPESVGQRSGWEALDAVENGRVYPFDDNLVSRPGPRLVDGLETIAKLLHPELFE